MRSVGRGYLRAVEETATSAGHLTGLVRELETVVGALGASEALRHLLTDPSVSPATRQGVVADLLVGRGLEETSSLVGFLVLTERPADLPSVLIQAAGAVGKGPEAEGDGAEVTAGDRTSARERLRGYAGRVLQELPGSEQIDEVEDELFRFGRLLDVQPRLRSVLSDVTIPAGGRVKVLDDLLEGKVQPATLRLARFVLRAGRLRDVVGTFAWLVELAAAERGRRVAEARSAVAPDDAEVARLAGALSRLVGRPVEVRVVIDPSVVGGMLVRVGDLRIDGTIRSRLEKLREALAGSS